MLNPIGKDQNAEKLRTVAESDGLHTEYMVDESTATGVCGVLITGHNRSMVTDLLAVCILYGNIV
jgi:adenosine kinase